MLLRMKFFSFFFIFCLIVPSLGLGAPDSQSEEAPEGFGDDYLYGIPKIRAATGVAPIQFVLDRIGGEFVDTISLIPTGYDPHTFEPKPSHLKLLEQADIYFSLSTPFEQAWLKRFAYVGISLRAVDLMATLVESEELLLDPQKQGPLHGLSSTKGKNTEMQEMSGFASLVDDELNKSEELDEQAPVEQPVPVYDGEDYHIWMSPYFLKKVAAVVAEKFSDQMPKQYAYFQKNLASFNARIEQVEDQFRKDLKDLPEAQKTFLVFHPSWTYFAQDFGLIQLAVEQDGKGPTPLSLAMVIDESRTRGISVIFVQKEFNPDMASTVAAHLPGGRVVVLSPLSYNCLKSIEDTGYAITGKSPVQAQTLEE